MRSSWCSAKVLLLHVCRVAHSSLTRCFICPQTPVWYSLRSFLVLLGASAAYSLSAPCYRLQAALSWFLQKKRKKPRQSLTSCSPHPSGFLHSGFRLIAGGRGIGSMEFITFGNLAFLLLGKCLPHGFRLRKAKLKILLCLHRIFKTKKRVIFGL